MIKSIWVSVSMSFLCVFCLSACVKSEKELSGKELVRINNMSISLDEFNQMTERLPLEKKMKLLSEKGLRDFLDNYVITREVLYQEAKKKGFDKSKEIETKAEEFKKAMVIDALIEEAMRGKGEISEAEMQQFYKENEERFTEPKEMKIRHLFVASEAALKEVLVRLSQGEDLGKLASLYNVDQSRQDQGSLGWIRRGQLASAFAQFEEVAFSLKKKGEVSEVVKTPYGYHLIQLDDTRGKTLKPFDQVKDKIQLFLQSKKRQDAYLQFVKEARAKAKIMVNEKLWAEEGRKELKAKEEKPKVEKSKDEAPNK